jgi:hypothetical protein
VAASLEADGVDGGIDLGYAQDLLDLILRVALGDVNGLTQPKLCACFRRSGIRAPGRLGPTCTSIIRVVA